MYLERTFLPLLLVVLFTFCTFDLSAQNDVDIRLSNPVFTGCPDPPETVCLDLQVSASTEGSDFLLGTSSYFIQFDDAVVSYASWTTSVPGSDYSTNPPQVTGPNFNVTVEYTGAAAETVPAGGWLTVGVICFDVITVGDPNIAFLNIPGFVGVNTVDGSNNQSIVPTNNFPDGEAYNGPLACPVIECPTFTSAAASVSAACSGDQVTITVITSDDSAVTVNWTLPGGASATGSSIEETATPIGITGCQETLSYAYTVVCNDDDSEIATGTVEVEVYPEVTATGTPGGCAASVSQDCPEFTATWDAGGGNSGAGFSFNAGTNESGTVTFTVTGGAGAPSGCTSIEVPVAYDCAADCPAFNGASADLSTVCSGSAVVLTANVSDESLATIEWTLPDASTSTAFTLNTTASTSGCQETLTYSYVVTCSDDGSQLAAGAVEVEVYPQVTGTASNGGCAASVSQDCPEFTATWDDGNGGTGAGFSFNAGSNESGTVTFTIASPGAPAACASANVQATYDCAANCPSFTEASSSVADVCDGGSLTLSAIVSDESLASITWTLPDGSTSSSFSLSTTATSIGGCNESQNYSYVILCTDDGSQLAAGDLTVNVYAQVTSTQNNGACSTSISQDCDDFTATWSDGTDSGSGFSYTAGSGESGTVNWVITNPGAPANCQTANQTTTYDCAADCPAFNGASTNLDSVCDGSTVSATVSVSDESLATVNWTLPDGSSESGFSTDVTLISTSGCTEDAAISYEVICNDDGSLISSGNLFVAIYPNITYTTFDGGCQASISQDCPEFVFTWDNGTNSDSGSTYTAAAGTAGTVDFTVTNPGAPAGCNSATAQATYACAADCPSFIDTTVDTGSVCDGGSVNASVNLSDATLATVTWTLPDGSTLQGTNINPTLTSTSGCGQQVQLAYVVVCDGDGSEVASGSIPVQIYADVTTTPTSGACAAFISQDCPEFTAEWTDSDFGSGSGFNYGASSGTSGTVQFTVTNPGAPAACASTVVSANYDCAANCPAVQSVDASSTSVCSGGTVSFSATLSDITLATVTWTTPDNSTSTGASLDLTMTSASCTETQTVSYLITCNEDGSTLSSGSFEIAVYAPVTGTVTEGGCSASVTVDCPNYFVSWADGTNTGDGASYTAASNTSGEVTFTINNSGAPEGCASASFPAAYDCQADCPSFVGATASATELCDGDALSIDLAVTDLGVPVVVWTLPDGSAQGSLSLNTTAESPDGCNATLSYAYELYCEQTGDLVASGSVEVEVFGNPSATVTNGGCAAFVSPACTEYTTSWDDGNTTGTGATYNAATGTSGTVSFTVSNPGSPNCAAASYEASYDCTVDCPSLTSVSASASAVCSGDNVTLTAVVTDPANTTISWSLGGGANSDALEVEVVASTTACSEILSYGYSVFCAADGSLLGEGSVEVEVFGPIDATVINGGCTASVTPSCPDYLVSWIAGAESGTGNTYTALAGESGEVVFTVSSDSAPADCSNASYTATYACSAGCPSVVSSNQSATGVCSGEEVSFSYELEGGAATVTWTLPDGSTQEGPSLVDNPVNANACSETVTYSVSIACTETGDVIETNSFSVQVAGTLPATAEISGAACTVSIAQVCPEYTAIWNDGVQEGTGFTYAAAAGLSGQVTFTVSSDCGQMMYNANYDCPTACPLFVEANSSSNAVCSGDEINLSLATTNNGNATATWTLPGGILVNDFSVITVAESSSGCNETLTYGYTVSCANTGELLSNGSIEVLVYGNPTASLSGTGCSVSATQDCPEFEASWTTDGAESGDGFAFSASFGQSGTVSFVVTNTGAPAGCASASFSQGFNCQANCPAVLGTPSSVSACSGETVTLEAIVGDGGSIVWTTPDGSSVQGNSLDVVASNTTSCAPIDQSYAYTITCDEDGSVLAEGSVMVSSYPESVEQFIMVEDVLDCTTSVAVMEECAAFISVSPALQDGPEGTSGLHEYAIAYTYAIDCGYPTSLSVEYDCPLSCNANAGTVTSSGAQSVCLGTDEVITFSAEGQTVPDGGQYDFIIVDNATGLVISFGPTAEISDVLAEGTYCVHGVSHDGSYSLAIGDGAPTETSGDCFAISSCVAAGVVDCGGCAATAGTLKANDSDVCSNETSIGATVDVPPLVPDGYQVIYVLTSGDDLVIQATSENANFDGLGVGSYTIHTLVYDPATLDLSIVEPGVTTGFDVNALLEQGGGDICAALLVAGAEVTIYDPVSAGADNSAVLCNGPDGDNPESIDLATLVDPAAEDGVWDLGAAPAGSVLGSVFTASGLPAGSDYLFPYIVSGNAGCEDDFALISITVEGCIATCDVAAGTLVATAAAVCDTDGTISATASTDPTVPDGYQVAYVLTSGAELVIQDSGAEAEFSGLAAGSYTIHTLVYDPSTLDLGIIVPGETTGFDVNALLLQGGGEICAALDVAGAAIDVNAAPDAGPGASASVCNNEEDGGTTVDLASLVSGDGTWDLSSAPEGSVDGSVFNGNGLEIGATYDFIYTVDGAEGCDPASATITITIIDCSIPCEVSAGTLEANSSTDVCMGSMVSAVTGEEPVVPAGSQILYVLTNTEDLVIVATSSTPEFELELLGLHTIHTLVYNPATLDLSVVEPGVTTGAEVLAIISDNDICADLLVAGPSYVSYELNNAGEGSSASVCNSAEEGEATVDLSALPSVEGGEWDLSAAPEGSLDGAVFSGEGLEAGSSYDFIYTVASNAVCPAASATFTITVVDCAVECLAEAGTLTIEGETSLCEDAATLTAISEGSNVPEGSATIYVLTSGDDLVIEQVADAPSFTVTESGSYTIHTLVYDPATLDLSVVVPGETTGVDVLNLVTENNLCASLLVDGAAFEVLPVVSAGDGQSVAVCANSDNGDTTIDLMSLLTEGVAEGEWDLSAAPEGSLDGSIFSGEGLELGSNYEFTYTVAANDACPAATATFTVTVADCTVECLAEAGALEAEGETTICGSSATLSALSTGSVVPEGYETIYVLTSGEDLVIEQVADMPGFEVSSIGIYTIHTLVYDPATLDLSIVVPGETTGVDVLNIVTENNLCASLLVDGAAYELFEVVSAGAGQDVSVCSNSEDGTTTVDLATLLESGVENGEWNLSAAPEGSINGSVFDAEGLDLGDYLFTYTVTGSEECGDAIAEFTVSVTDCSGPEVTTVGGNVFNDANGNEIRDEDEFGIEGALVSFTVAGPDGILGTTDDIETQTTTDEDGNYSFETLNFGDGDLQINTPEPFSSTIVTIEVLEGTVITVDYPAVPLDCNVPITIDVNVICNDNLQTYDATVSIDGGYPIHNGDSYTVTGSFEGEVGNEFVLESLSYDSTLSLTVTDNAGCETSYELLPDPCVAPNAVELLKFDGTATAAGNHLMWMTANEVDNDSFTLTRSEDGVTFEAIATIPSRGNSSSAQHYDFIDGQLAADKYYYQLLITDLDGSQVKSNVVVLSTKLSDAIVSITPNPASNMVNLDFVASSTGRLQIELIDIVGRQVAAFDVEVQRGYNNVSLDLVNYPVGVYFISLVNDDSRTTEKLIKE